LKHEFKSDFDTYCYAAINGKLNIIKWLFENNFNSHGHELNQIDLSTYNDIKCTYRVFNYAAQDGNLDVMKWLLENNFGHDIYTFSYADENGNLDNIEWLLENNFEQPVFAGSLREASSMHILLFILFSNFASKMLREANQRAGANMMN